MELCNYPKKEQIRYYEIEAIENQLSIINMGIMTQMD